MGQPNLMRAIAVAAVAAAILVPISLIKGKISERQQRADEVVRQFAAETSGAQVIGGPMIAATCEEMIADSTPPRTVGCPTAYFVPQELRVTGDMPVEVRHRGIYPIRFFHAQLDMTGQFRWPAPPAPDGMSPRAWKHLYAVFRVSDPRGIRSFSAEGLPVVDSSAVGPDVAQFTVRADLGEYAAHQGGSTVPFRFRMGLTGTGSLAIAPVGDTSEIRLTSSWPHPSFMGAASPDEQAVGPAGYTATWRTTSIATGGQATWGPAVATNNVTVARSVGVSLFDPVNIYALSHRATEYAFLFVLFTYGALALAEASVGVQMHPVQYALVGCAVAIFFLLLIALSEHIPFVFSYAIAAAACVALLTYYLRHPLGTVRRTAIFFLFFAGLYATLYGLLKSEDNALLLGSIMVFVLLAVVMVATRRKDWGSLGAPASSAPGDD